MPHTGMKHMVDEHSGLSHCLSLLCVTIYAGALHSSRRRVFKGGDHGFAEWVRVVVDEIVLVVVDTDVVVVVVQTCARLYFIAAAVAQAPRSK